MSGTDREPDSSKTEQFVRMFAGNQRLIHGFILSLVPNWADAGWPTQGDVLPPGHSYIAGTWSPYIGRYAIDRHNNTINIAYLDGHVNQVAMEDLWYQRWHRKWNPHEAP